MDTRTTARLRLELPATVTTAEGEHACVVASLSLGGVFVRGVRLPMDMRLMLRFTIPRHIVLEIECTARWLTEDGTGLMFEGLRAADTYDLLRYIRAHATPQPERRKPARPAAPVITAPRRTSTTS